MASLEMVSTQMFDFVPRNHNRKKKDLKVLVRDLEFIVNDSVSKEDGKSKTEVLECSSRSSVSETKKSLPIPVSTSSHLETNSSTFYKPGQPENPSRNDSNMGASSLVQIWEARSQQSSPSNSSPFSESLSDDLDWCSQSDRSYVSNSWEKEREARNGLPSVTGTPRVRGRQAFLDILMMIMRERKNELKRLASCCAVSKFSPRASERLRYMFRTRCLEKCIAIQARHQSKSANRYSNRYKNNTGKVNSAVETRISSSPVSSQEKKDYKMTKEATNKNVLEETTEESYPRMTQEATYKPKITKIAILSEDISNKDGLRKPETERKVIEKGESSRGTIEKVTVKESVETKKTSILSFAEKVNMWDANERSYRRRNTEKAGKASRRVIVVEEIAERNKETRKKEVVSSFEEGKSREIEEYRINPQELTTMVSFDERKEEETASYRKEEKSPQGDEETSKVEKQETLCFILESPRFLNSWEETEMEDEYSVESEYYDWISGISQPRSYWDGLRKQREKEIMMNKDPKKDYMRDMIKKKTVSTFLASDFREEIDKMISCARKKIQVEINPEEEDSEEWNVECSTSYQENLEENETEKIDQTVTISDGFSQSSVKSTKSFEDHEAVITSQSNSSNPKDLANTSSYETDVICDLREQIKQLQGEMLELKSLVKSCVDFQKSVKLESFSGV